jgi:hypothetical protein
MIGATLTLTEMPASERVRIVRRRRAGAAARGSSVREIAGSSAVDRIGLLPRHHRIDHLALARNDHHW